MQSTGESKKPKKQRATSQSSRPAIGEIYRELADILNNESYSGHPKIQETFFIIQPERGQNLVVQEISPGIVRYVDRFLVVGCLLRYIEENLGGSKYFALGFRQAKECVDYWATKTDPIPMPKAFADADDPSRTFHRLPFTFKNSGKDTPYFTAILSRMNGQAEVVRHWLGSLFDPDSDRSTYLWIYGEGNDGKGRLANVLMRIFGPAFLGTSVPEKGDATRFWVYSLLGKRLVTFSDCNNYTFPMHGIFKSITGGDAVQIEQKNRDSFSATIDCKFLFLSNERPAITGTKANLRRALYVEMRPMTKDEELQRIPSATLEKHLWDEAADFFGRCIDEYREKYPNHGPIVIGDTNHEGLNSLIEENEEWMSVLTDKYLVPQNNTVVLSSRLQEIRNTEKLSHHDYRNWLAYMRRNHKIVPYRNKEIRGWRGLRLRDSTESVLFVIEKNENVAVTLG